MDYETITVKPLSPVIGGEIGGVDLSKPLGNQTFTEVHDALLRHQVIFFREQEMSIEEHRRSCASTPTRTPSVSLVTAGTPTSRATSNHRWGASCI